jgi:hypothetical protein
LCCYAAVIALLLHHRRSRVRAEKTGNNKGVGSMDVECEVAIGTEQRETVAGEPAAAPPAELEPAHPPDHARPRGRPWVAGQSGNPAGRPPRIHPPAAVAEYVIGRKTIPLAKKVRDLALSGDRSMLRLWYQHVAMSSRGSPDWSALPLVADRAELRGLREAVAEAAAKGAITPAQADALVRIVNTVMAML